MDVCRSGYTSSTHDGVLMNVWKWLSLSGVMALILSQCVFAHGTLGSVDRVTGILIFASYDDGDPMSYAEVSILVDGQPMPFQTGRTDKKGRFMVFPEGEETYKALIKDGMGHGITLLLPSLDEGVMTGKPSGTGSPPSKKTGLLAGLAVIFFLSGLGFWWAGWKKSVRH